VFTPKHASWLNANENFFSKITRNLLGTIRVESKDELSKRIDLYIDQLNEEPTKPSWKYRLEEKKRFMVGLLYEIMSIIRNRCTCILTMSYYKNDGSSSFSMDKTIFNLRPRWFL
jgi:hypothetical protein